jgi:hypothetical protein
MSIIATLDASVKEMLHSAGDCWGEVKFECTPSTFVSVWPFMRQILHTPYFPWYTKPGWLMPFFTGPYDATFYENLQGDFFAGFTVAITLIPQARL